MHAARWFGRRDVRVVVVDDPAAPGPGFVRLRVQWCGICATDLEEYTDGPVFLPTAPHALTGRVTPLTLGHEMSGVVEALGEGVDLPLGARVAVDGNRFCGSCRWCLQGRYNLCPRSAQYGLHDDGGFADQIVVPAWMCFPYGDGIDAGHAALTEPIAVAVRAIRQSGLQLGHTVVVIGAGALGLLLVQLARLSGATKVCAVEPSPVRRKVADELGADVVTDSDQVGSSGDLTADVVFEAAGTPEAMRLASELTGRGGTTVLVGITRRPLTLDTVEMIVQEKRIVTSISHVFDRDFASAIDLVNEGSLSLDPIVTARIALADIVEKGFEALLSPGSTHIKVLVAPVL